jgi:hypothetical protein
LTVKRSALVTAAIAAVTLVPAANSAAGTHGKAPYNPNVDPANFVPDVTNPYYPLIPGTSITFNGTRDGKPEHVEVKILPGWRTIQGVKCRSISDIVTSNFTLVEKTTDWYAQDKQGNVWYFGEDTKEYTNGVVSSTAGTWEAGVDNAKPGIIMHAKNRPLVGRPPYRQEYRPGIAEDMAQVLSTTGSMHVPAGTFHHLLQTRDTDPLNPDKLEQKRYARGVGLIWADRKWTGHHEQIKLVKYQKP